MAIDKELIADVRPSESAVDRLRKRNRIRPWESNLVGAPTKAKSEIQGVGDSPPGQVTQRVENPEPSCAMAGPPVGISPSGSPSHGVAHPLGKSPSGCAAQGVTHPLAPKNEPDHGRAPQISSDTPTGGSPQGVNYPVGKLPSGSPTQSNKPTGLNASEAKHPVGDSPTGSGSTFEPAGYLTQRASCPVGNLPTGQEPLQSRIQSLSGFDPTPFVPMDKGAVLWREKGSGELRIPHRLYEFAHRVTSTRNELLVFDCLLRFSLGFHRAWCEAGYSFIAAWTGINDITNIKKSLKTLMAAGLVVKTKEHNSASHSGAIYELPVVQGYLEYVATKKEGVSQDQAGKRAVGDLPSGSLTHGGGSPPEGGQTTHRAVGVLPPKKENSNKYSKKTLSHERSVDLDRYVDQIKPASKRESEIHFLGKLLSEYRSQEVILALTYVQRFGVLGTREPCHSPLKYLCTAMEEVLRKARENQALAAIGGKRDPVSNDDKSTGETDSAQTRLRDIALAAFETELPQAEQDHLLAEVTKENSVMGYAPPMNVLRSMAAMKWFESRGCRT